MPLRTRGMRSRTCAAFRSLSCHPMYEGQEHGTEAALLPTFCFALVPLFRSRPVLEPTGLGQVRMPDWEKGIHFSEERWFLR